MKRSSGARFCFGPRRLESLKGPVDTRDKSKSKVLKNPRDKRTLLQLWQLWKEETLKIVWDLKTSCIDVVSRNIPKFN